MAELDFLLVGLLDVAVVDTTSVNLPRRPQKYISRYICIAAMYREGRMYGWKCEKEVRNSQIIKQKFQCQVCWPEGCPETLQTI